MKMFLKAACVAFVLTVLYSMLPFQAACRDISDEVFRLHIVANSDSDADQALKLKVRDRVLTYTKTLFENAKSKDEAEALISGNLQAIADTAINEIRQNGSRDPVRAEMTRMYFTTRHYENYTLPSGMYDALRLTIGKGEGHNWWCVMFPSVCISSDSVKDKKAKEVFDENEYRIVKQEKREYKFFIVEFFEKIASSVR